MTNKFHIIRSDGEVSSGLIPIILNLTRAFGTGEHATTMGCLTQLESYESNDAVKDILDIGTGTGILAIAAKKLWPEAMVLATDIDKVAIDVTELHAKSNNVSLELFVMDGVDALGSDRKYDIILANILARPLLEMAESISVLLRGGGIVILSGFLENQLVEILSKYISCGLSKVRHVITDNWVTLVLSK